MKKVFALLGILVISVIPLAAASCGPGGLSASLGEQFTLPIGQTIAIKGTDLKITFEEVNGDSRCATGNTCVWEGVAKCRGIIDYAGDKNIIIFTITGSGVTDQSLAHGFTASYTLEPYPVAGQTIAHGDYYLLMTVTRE
ncbi:MAG: hypothetical protein WC370_00680 [Dehalococcoidales bacterium]|jgi:hypothetical protein